MLLVVCNDFALVLPMIYEFIGLPSIQEVSLVEPESMGQAQDPISCFCCVKLSLDYKILSRFFRPLSQQPDFKGSKEQRLTP